jgi:hypothetical protein
MFSMRKCEFYRKRLFGDAVLPGDGVDQYV